jgi:hypothetical protein
VKVDSGALPVGGWEDRTAGLDRTAFVVTVLCAGLTFWLAPRLPMTDLPQHAGQVAAWHDLVLGTSKWQPLLYVNYFTPYLIAYSLGLVASFVLPVSAAVKLVLMLAFWGFVAACTCLRGRLGGDRRLDWLFVPGFFGFAFGWGFYTFLVALPFGMFFMVLAHRYAERPTVRMGIALLGAELVLFFAHGLVFLFANAVGGLFLLLRQRRLARLVPALAPFVAAGLLCVLYVLVRLRIETFAVGEPTEVVWNWDVTRASFLMFALSWPALGMDWARGLILMLLLAAPMVLRSRPSRDAAAYAPLAVLVAVWVGAPTMAMNTWFLFERFAVFLLPAYAFIFRSSDPAAAGRRGAIALLLLPVLSWAFLIVHTERLRAFVAESASFEEVLQATRPGYRALSLIFAADSPAMNHPTVYWHFPLWYQAERGGFVDLNAAGSLPPVVRYRPDRLPAAFSGTNWEWRPPTSFDWTKDHAGIYRYFFVHSDRPLPPDFFAAGVCTPVLLKSAGRWSVFENVNCYKEAP